MVSKIMGGSFNTRVDIRTFAEQRKDAIVVDAECDQWTKVWYYRGTTFDGTELFAFKPLPGGSHNIVEFIAAVHGLAYCKEKGLTCPVYSCSQTAIAWIRDKKVNTNIKWEDHNSVLKVLCQRALVWVIENPVHNELLKWDTRNWGDNPAYKK